MELLITASLMVVVLGGVVYSHLMGGKLMQFAAAKLGASDSAREAFGKLQDEIRAATTIQVGDGTASIFVPATNGAALQGRAVQIFPPPTRAGGYVIIIRPIPASCAGSPRAMPRRRSSPPS